MGRQKGLGMRILSFGGGPSMCVPITTNILVSAHMLIRDCSIKEIACASYVPGRFLGACFVSVVLEEEKVSVQAAFLVLSALGNTSLVQTRGRWWKVMRKPARY